MVNSRKHLRGFTLIELLVVISIIGVLSTVVLVSVSASREKAKAAKLMSDLKQVEKAFITWGIDEEISEWWHEDEWGAPTDEPEISWLIESTSLGEILLSSPDIDTNIYVYDNDGDTFDTDGDGCADGSLYQGVYLNIWDQDLLDVIEIVDRKIDGGDGPSCGKIIWDEGGGGGYFIGYRLGNNSRDIPF
jgi:prepilin-type N-terminal cleavage/methylation domain-containing protein